MEQDKRAAATLRLLKIMDELREKCPWDRKQSFETLRGNTISLTTPCSPICRRGRRA